MDSARLAAHKTLSTVPVAARRNRVPVRARPWNEGDSKMAHVSVQMTGPPTRCRTHPKPAAFAELSTPTDVVRDGAADHHLVVGAPANISTEFRHCHAVPGEISARLRVR